MIFNNEKLHYLAVTRLPTLLQDIPSKYKGDFYCSNCFYSFRNANKVNSHEKVCKNHTCCQIILPDEENKITISSWGKFNNITISDIRKC